MLTTEEKMYDRQLQKFEDKVAELAVKNQEYAAELAALRAENEVLLRARDNALFQVEGLIKEMQGKCAENAKLRDALELVTQEGVGFTEMSQAVESALNSTTPDPLYSAAPEMLEALETLAESIGFMEFEHGAEYIITVADVKLIRAAIARAKGESA